LNIALIGRNGQIAWDLQGLLPRLGQVFVLGRPEMDLSNPGSLRRALRQLKPSVIVNAAAYTAVDQAEAEPELAMTVNAEAPRVMAEEAKHLGATFITYSTDYVFDGTKTSPYTELDVVNPLGVYGASKLAGDRAVEAVGGNYLIFRTSWVYASRGKNFLRTIMKLAAEREELPVVDDQIGAPTASQDIARSTVEILGQILESGPQAWGPRRGLYNMTAQGSTSWFHFAAALVQEMRDRGMGESGLAKVTPIPTVQYPTPAMRPKNSCLANEKIRDAFGVTLPEWKTSLLAVMEQIVLGKSVQTI
jgi:dTDP-4-dehydrorhamnose reductase